MLNEGQQVDAAFCRILQNNDNLWQGKQWSDACWDQACNVKKKWIITIVLNFRYIVYPEFLNNQPFSLIKLIKAVRILGYNEDEYMGYLSNAITRTLQFAALRFHSSSVNYSIHTICQYQPYRLFINSNLWKPIR